MCSLKDSPQQHISDLRIARLKDKLRTEGADAMFVRNTANIEWLTAFRDVFDDEQAHAAFVSTEDDLTYVHTDSRYSTAMEREASNTSIEVDSEVTSFSDWAFRFWNKLGSEDEFSKSKRKLAIEDSISLSQYRALEKAFGRPSAFAETSGLILGLRAVKDESEISAMRSAQAITDAAFTHIVNYMRPGMTERDVQMELDQFMLEKGASGLAFQTIVACGENGASPHAIVSSKKLEAGQCVVMDFGARFGGYCSDMTRTVFLGEPTATMRSAWDTLVCANESVEAILKPHITGKQAHELALSILADGGFEGRMGHGLGHGVGLEIHEEPVLSPRNEKELMPGNVVTVEPGIYIPGEFGMRLEDFGVITEDGFDVFTQSTHEMIVL